MRDRDILSDAIGRAIDIDSARVSIAPNRIADGAMKVIGFDYSIHNSGYYGCFQHLLQLARARLRGRFDVDQQAKDYVSGESDLFGDKLQDRYPRKPRRQPDGTWNEPEYILRDHLNEEDRWFNFDRLESVSLSAARHRDALEAETVKLFGPRKRAA